MKINQFYKSLLGLTILVLLVFASQLLFKLWIKADFFTWYLKNGAMIGIATTAVSLVWGNMRLHSGLISANPWEYIGSYLQLVGLPIYVFGTHLKSDTSKKRAISLFDMLVTVLFMIVLSIVLLLWLITIVPLQYFIYLICGAPGRFLSNSPRIPIAKLQASKLTVEDAAKNTKLPEGWWNASIADKPVALTSLFSSLFFLILKPLLV